MNRSLDNLLSIYNGSNGDATQELYDELKSLGPEGFIAMNLFRAQKASARAKLYRGRQYRNSAYDKKDWSIKNLAEALDESGQGVGITWGWAVDPTQNMHKWVFYVDLPTGQVSYHTRSRGFGPMYLGVWDGVRDQAPVRICKWITMLFHQARTAPPILQRKQDASI